MSDITRPHGSTARARTIRLAAGLSGRVVLLAFAIGAQALHAQVPLAPADSALGPADSALVGRILLAEDRRDSLASALRDGAAHRDMRVRLLALRAVARIRDPRFAARDSIAVRAGTSPLPSPRVWPEPDWKTRYRALAAEREDCAALRTALADPAWPVRLRAADLVAEPCASDTTMIAVLRGWVDDLPGQETGHERGGVSWHAAAHAIVALARVWPDDARPRMAGLAEHPVWHVRLYAARAAALLSDTLQLRAFARDPDDNVKEAALQGLSEVAGHAADDVYLAALRAEGAQAVRAAAIALKGSPVPAAAKEASAAFERWVKRRNASSRDARIALLEAAGRPASDDRPPELRVKLPPGAVALALGDTVVLRVTMSNASGGGSFAVRLRGDVAPIMSARVLALAEAGYYDNTAWHRVEHDFVIQGLGPGNNEYVGYKDFFRDELGTVPHARGTIGMSTRGHDTGDAQWFVNLKDNLRLGRDYTVFAEVVEGMDVVDDIMEGDVVATVRVVP